MTLGKHKHILELLITSNFRVQVKSFSGQFKIFLMLAKNHQKDFNSLDDPYWDSLLFYNDGHLPTTNVAPYKAIMDASDKDLMGK